MPTSRIALLCLSLCLSPSGYAKTANEHTDFITTYSQLKAGKNRDYSRFKDYILYPYLEYEYLINNLSSTSSETMERFIQRYADSPLSRQLGIHLAQRNNDEKRWDQTFLQ
ncbi:MAG: hypothetical protein ACPG47_03770, partial [Leucothrix sp.]